MFKVLSLFLLLVSYISASGQLHWVNMDTAFGDLPASVHIYKSNTALDGKPSIAWYLEADLRDRQLEFTTDTTLQRRFTPQQFYEKNNNPLVVVNTTFFSFATNQNLNLVIRDGRLVSYNIHSIAGRGKDTLTYLHPLGSAIGISKKRKADVSWLYTDSTKKFPLALQAPRAAARDSNNYYRSSAVKKSGAKKWKMQTAVGGGPVLVQDGRVKVTNEEERKFYGKAINDKHPRTAIGYTKDDKLIILMIEGRNPGVAEGASLTQLAEIFTQLGAVEALNLDGGGSSCMLVNGRETIHPSDKKQRPVPAVLMIKKKS